MSTDPVITVRPVGPELREDFFRVHSDGCGAGWCSCVAWWVSTWEGWGDRTAIENRTLREALFDRGEHDGFLLYVDGAPKGWCQCGPRDRWPKLTQSYHLEPDPEMYALTCFLLAPDVRGTGLAHELLEQVLEHLAQRGVTRVQAFPRRGHELPADDVWTGPEALFKKADFNVVRDDPARPIYELHMARDAPESRPAAARLGYILTGHLAMLLAAIAFVLPLVPATPFLLVAAACYYRGSRHFYHWLTGQRWLGPYVRDLHHGRGLPRSAKIAMLIGIVGGMVISQLLFLHAIWARVLFGAFGVVMAGWVLRLPTRR